jgi:hypothetical protein
MAVYSFQLLYTPGVGSVFLRELNGHDELMREGAGTMGALNLLHHIIVPPAFEKNKVVKAEKIITADRDYLLAGVYQFTYGPRIQSVLPCAACQSKFDLDFMLPDWMAHVRQGAPVPVRDEEGFYHMADETRFRLPDGTDEMAVWGYPVEVAAEMLLQRCVPGPFQKEKWAAVQQAMAEQAPVLLADMGATCPECGHFQNAHFDMQSFLLARIKNERNRVAAEVHCLAVAYGWAHREILDLPRSLRKTYVSLTGFE